MTRVYVIRHGQMRMLGQFEGLSGQDHPRGQRVVVRTDRGTEIGDVLCPATDRAAAFLNGPTQGKVLRVASPTDLEASQALAQVQTDAFDVCQTFVTRRALQMRLVDVEAILGGERLVFYYLAEKRVDFRELVKDLARTFHTRIEMRQIGVRDEAKLLADYGDCGKPVCCNTHLTAMPPVTMRMAKVQKTTLDPSKVSGRCGRLKCCLRYEFDTYQDLERTMPAVGDRVHTPKGSGRVIAQELLAQKLLVEFDDHRRVLVAADEAREDEPRPARPQDRASGHPGP